MTLHVQSAHPTRRPLGTSWQSHELRASQSPRPACRFWRRGDAPADRRKTAAPAPHGTSDSQAVGSGAPRNCPGVTRILLSAGARQAPPFSPEARSSPRADRFAGVRRDTAVSSAGTRPCPPSSHQAQEERRRLRESVRQPLSFGPQARGEPPLSLTSARKTQPSGPQAGSAPHGSLASHRPRRSVVTLYTG